MKKISYIIFGLIIALSYSCREDDRPYSGYINVDPVLLEYKDASLTVTADTDISGDITASVDEAASEWCQVSVNGKDITVKATDNLTDAQRYAKINIKSGYRVSSFQVIQKKEGLNPMEHSPKLPQNWTVEASSTQENDGTGVKDLFNDDQTKYWHSSYNPLAPLPHSLIVNMYEVRDIAQVRLGWRQYGTNFSGVAKIIEIQTSENGTDFTKVAEIDRGVLAGWVETNPPYNDFIFDTVKAQYIKIIIKATNNANGAANVGYIKAYYML